jgi:hypothetical protein
MLFEQSFLALPEFLFGLPYSDFDYEGTLVTAFGMAVLQELNGRNINHPISFIRGEVGYPVDAGKRADLHLNLANMGILSPELEGFGIKPDNWLEAKFYRINQNNEPTVDSLKATLLLLKDLLRLVLLPPEAQFPVSRSARYLLHAYRGVADNHLAERKNRRNNSPGFTRSWTNQIRAAGLQDLLGFRFHDEVGQFDTIIGPLFRNVVFTATVQNFCYVPCAGRVDLCHLFLTRIESATVTYAGHSFSLLGSTMTEATPGDYAHLQTTLCAAFAA